MMTICELKEAIAEFKKKNAFHYELRDDEYSQKLFNPNPENFEIIMDEKRGKKYVIPAMNDLSLLFRGQSREISPCFPSLYRHKISNLGLFVERMRLIEFELLLETHPLVQFYIKKGFALSCEGLAQHYGLKTEILDFTSDIDIALFFAMCPYDHLSDEYKLPEESSSHTGIIYMLNPMIYDSRAINGNQINIFEDLVEPIGLQPFERPALQRGYGVKLRDNIPLQRVLVYDFEYTMEEAKEYFDRFNNMAKLWIEDELVRPSIEIANKRHFIPKVFKKTWERYPVNGLTKSQCCKHLEKMGIVISQKAKIVEFDKQSMSEELLTKRWNSYVDRVIERPVYTGTETGVGQLAAVKKVSPFMTTGHIATLQLFRIATSGCTYPKGGRACR